MCVDEQMTEYPINGVLDLHTFHPREVKSLVPEYLRECRSRGILQVRIIHGKGKGVLREIVRSELKKLDYVLDYFHEGGTGGGWGATVVILKPEN